MSFCLGMRFSGVGVSPGSSEGARPRPSPRSTHRPIRGRGLSSSTGSQQPEPQISQMTQIRKQGHRGGREAWRRGGRPVMERNPQYESILLFISRPKLRSTLLIFPATGFHHSPPRLSTSAVALAVLNLRHLRNLRLERIADSFSMLCARVAGADALGSPGASCKASGPCRSAGASQSLCPSHPWRNSTTTALRLLDLHATSERTVKLPTPCSTPSCLTSTG